MKKKLWCVLCIVTCMLLIPACGQKKESGKEKTEKAEQAETKFKDRESLEMSLLTVYYPKTWKYDKENMQEDEDYAYVRFFDGKTADESENVVYIEATKEDSYKYRNSLVDFGVELEKYAKGEIDTATIGNAEYAVMPENNSGRNTYMYRHEESGTSYDVRVKGQETDDATKELLEGIVLKLEDEGNKDAPWPWEGEPVEPVLAEQMVGSYTIVPEYIPFKEAQGVMQIMEHQFVKQGDQVFHLLGNKLDTYKYSESGLEFVSSMELENDCEYMSADSSGMLYLSPGIQEVIGVKDGKKALQTTVTGDLNMHPSGEWGISFWVNSDTQKISNQGGNLTAEPWILTGLNDAAERKGEFSMIDDVQITDSHIMVAGSMAAEDEGTKIIVYDYEGNQLLKLGGADISSPDRLGSITGMAETENGFVAADGNMREIQFWAKDGTHIGAISTDDIFGVDYPWLEDMQLLDDGSLLILLTQKRNDESANELMFFRLTGF